jgi:hypothetical protein
MTDHEQLLAEFRSEVPLPDAETTERIRRHAMRPQARAPRRRLPLFLRRPRTGIVLAAALVIVGGSVAAVNELPWWQNGAPPVDPQSVASIARDNLPANVDTSRARTVAQVGDAALVAVPLNKTGYCLIPSLGGRANLGGGCMYQVVDPQQGSSDQTRSLARPAPAAWIVYGRITDSRAAKIDLGAFSVRLKTGGFFLAQVPEVQWPTLDGRANPGRILDASGATLRTGCVNWGPAPTNRQAGDGGVSLWARSNAPCKPQPSFGRPTLDLDNASKLVELTLAADFSIWKAGTVVALWQAPADQGRICTYVAAASPAPTGTSDGPPSGPGQCHGPADEPAASAARRCLGVSFSAGSGGLITGQVGARSGVTKIVLESASETTVLPLGGGRFIGQLPEGGAKGQLPPGGPFTLIAYNADGKELARRSLEQIQKAATPPSG